MTCQPYDCLPPAIDAGETVVFHVSDTCHTSNLWTGVLWLNNGIAAATSVALTANTDGRRFDCTISATVSATLALGPTTAQPLFTNIASSTVKEWGRASQTTVLPSLAATASPSPAQLLLTALNAAILKLSGSANLTVSFNGQTYTRQSITALYDERVRLQAEVIREQQELLRLRGGKVNSGRIETEFIGPFCGPFYGSPFPGSTCCP